MGEARILDAADEAEFFAGARYATEFFMNKADVHVAMEELARRLEELDIPYAIVGAMALNLYKYRRVTVDVDVLLTRDGLARFKEHWLGRGYVEKFIGSKGLRDVSNGVNIDVIFTGEYPGDGKPKPVVFPDPAEEAVAGERVKLLPLERFIELKIASGISAPHRLKDLADVLELIKARNLPADLEARLDESVRPKFRELWAAAQHRDEE
jgi:hypothetical protein